MQSMRFEAARDAAKSTSLRTALGSQRALEGGKTCTSTHTPYGLHRLYLTSNGKPHHIIQYMLNGVQKKLHHQTREVLEIYGTVGGKSAGHYRKQKAEQVFLVAGEEKEVSAIRLMFKRRWTDGWGGRRIANELDALGVLAPRGGGWSQRQVEVVTENLIYTGSGIANLSSSAIFHKRSKGGPIPVEIDPVILASKATLPVNLRSPEEWTVREEPYLRDYLPEPLRSIAAKKIRALWESRCRGEAAPREGKSKRADSVFLFTGKLRAKQDG
jgi:hypothetical protein